MKWLRATCALFLLPSIVLAATPSNPPPVTNGVLVWYWDGTKSVVVTPSAPLPVTATFSGTVTTGATAGTSPPSYSAGVNPLSQNLFGGLRAQLSLAGTDIGLGQQVKAASIPVAIASDQKVPITVDQTTPGTTNGISIVGVNAAVALAGAGAVGAGAQRVAVGQDATTAAGMAPGTVAPGTAPANTAMAGCQYNATVPAATDTQGLAVQCDLSGRVRVNTLPSTFNAVSGTATQTSTTSTSLIGAVASNRIYTTAFACYNSGSSTSVISFQDGSGGTTLYQTIVPAGGGSNLGGGTALFKTTAGNALFFAPATGSTTIGCSASGFSAL